jgi:hypothetical protein
MNNEKATGDAPPLGTGIPSPAPASPVGPLTQVEILAEAFDRGERLTVAIALGRYGIYALSQRCGELAKWFPVESRTVCLPNGKRVSEYFKGGIAHG